MRATRIVTVMLVIADVFAMLSRFSKYHGGLPPTDAVIVTPPFVGACGVALAWLDSGLSPLALTAVAT